MAPKHPKKEVEAAITFARQRGWTVEQRKGHGHAWGVLRCSPEECTFYVWSTPRNPGNHAKQIQRFVIRCPHHDD